MAIQNNTQTRDIGTQAAERGLLADLFYKPDKIVEIIDELNPELFSVKEFSIIYRCIVDLWKEDIHPDEVTVINRAANLGHALTPELVKKLANSSTKCFKRNLKAYANIIKANSFKRKVVSKCEEFLENAKNVGSPEKIVGEFMNLAIDMQDKMKAENTMREICVDEKALMDDLDFRFEHPDYISGLTTGYAHLDNYLDGFCPGEIITITGQNSAGKSYFSQCIAFNQALWLMKNKIDKKIFIQTPEMTKRQVENRFIQMITGIQDKYLKRPKLFFIDNHQDPSPENFAKFKQHIANAVKTLNQMPIIIDDYASPSADLIAANIKKIHLKYGLAVCYVDYAGKITNDGLDEWKTYEYSYRVLTNCAKTTQVPVVMVNQYLKDLKENKAEGYRGTMQNLAGGKSAMNESHKILHVYRPEVFDDIIHKHPELKGKTYIYADKVRDGVMGSVMPDCEMQMYNGILRQANEIMSMNQEIVNGLENFK